MATTSKPSKEKIARLMKEAKNGTVNVDELESIQLTIAQKAKIIKILASRKN